jgi:hypothetical protein
MVISLIAPVLLRGGAILGSSLGTQTVKQSIASTAIFGLGYGALTNVGYNVANVGTSGLRSSKSYNKSNTYYLNSKMPYRRASYSRYGSRYPRYPSRYSRYGSRRPRYRRSYSSYRRYY